MKTNIKIPFLLISLLILGGCFPKVKVKSDDDTPTTSGGTDPVDGGDGTTDGGTSGNGNNTGGGTTTVPNGVACMGTVEDGTGEGYPIHVLPNIELAGHQAWIPGSAGSQTSIQDAALLFKSDSRLKIRFQVSSQPLPVKGEEYCHGRKLGQPADRYTYTMLKFRVWLRDVVCDDVDPTNSNNCLSGFKLGPKYRSQVIGPIDVNYCSNTIDIGSMRNQTQFGTVIEIEDVRSDSHCKENGDRCPSEQIVRAASCWGLTLQIVTDYTKDFK